MKSISKWNGLGRILSLLEHFLPNLERFIFLKTVNFLKSYNSSSINGFIIYQKIMSCASRRALSNGMLRLVATQTVIKVVFFKIRFHISKVQPTESSTTSHININVL